MKKIVKLTESDLTRIVRRVIKENEKSINEENWFSKISKAFSGDDSKDEYEFGGKHYNDFARTLNKFEDEDPFVTLYSKNPGKEMPIKYTVRKIDDCSGNKVFFVNHDNEAMISYCNYDGEKTIEELDMKRDPMWIKLKSEAEDKFLNNPRRSGMSNLWSKK